MTLTIRPAIPRDAEAIAELGRRSFTWAFGTLFRDEVLARYLDDTYGVPKIAGSLGKPANAYFVAEAEGRLQGFLKLKVGPSADGTWQVQKLYVDPEAIQRGVGRRLMGAGEALMATHGVLGAWLVVYRGNERALRFYRSLGYTEAGVEFHDFEDIRIEFRRMARVRPAARTGS